MNQYIGDIKFSILIPSYNRPQLLKFAIESVLSSNYANFELIVSDDKSPNFSQIQEVIDLFTFDNRLKFYSQEYNLGSVENKNFLIDKSVGDYLIFVGDDDIIDPLLLDNLVFNYHNFISKDNIICFGYNIINEYGKILDNFNSIKKIDINLNYPKRVNILYNCNTLPFWFFHPFSLCCPKNVYTKIKYRSNVNIGYDFYFLFEAIYSNFTISVLPFIGFSWRKASKNSNYQNLSNNKISDILSRIEIFQNFFVLKNSTSDINIRFHNLVCNTIFYNNLENDVQLLNYIRNNLGQKYFELFDYHRKRKLNIFFKIFYRYAQFIECYKFLGLTSFKYIFSRLLKKIKLKIYE